MFDNDTKEKVYTGVRASNTHETLKPRDIFESVRELLPTPPTSQEAWNTLKEAQDNADRLLFPKEVVRVDLKPVVSANDTQLAPKKPEQKPAPGIKTPQPPRYGPIGNLIPGDSNVPSCIPMGKPLEIRVQRLEEQVSALLDRIAIYNSKSSHKF